MFETIRDALVYVRQALDWASNGVVTAVILTLTAGAAWLLHGLLARLARRIIPSRHRYAQSVLARIGGATRLALVVLAMFIAVPAAPLDPEARGIVIRLLVLATIGLIGWSAITAANTAAAIYLHRFRVDTEDNLLARKHLTQVRILTRALDTLLIMVTIGAALMTFEPVRQYGVSLFASAGVVGIVVGLAARPVLSNLIAGVQIAVTQPIRMDDAVVVEGEWGSIEEITSTYVVVRLWDWRRMILPLTYFIERPFQNWTREGAEIIGTVMLYLDYTAPIARIREKAAELAAQSKLWNRKVVNVQVSDAKEGTIEVRIVVSANSAPAAWDLRCEMREKLIDFLQREHPQALPRRRQEVYEPKALERENASRKYAVS
jgi:small-conductance mechanosensitive channel